MSHSKTLSKLDARGQRWECTLKLNTKQFLLKTLKTNSIDIFMKLLLDLLAWSVIGFWVYMVYSFFNPLPPKVSPEIDYQICKKLLREMIDTKTQVEVDSVKSRAITANCSDTVINYRNKFPLDRYR